MSNEELAELVYQAVLHFNLPDYRNEPEAWVEFTLEDRPCPHDPSRG